MSAENEVFTTYFSARIRARKSMLFSRAEFDEMLEANDIQVAVDKMLASEAYAEDMAEALTRLQGADAVEEAAGRNLVRTFQWLYRNATEDRYKRLAKLFLNRWDLSAVKSLLRFRHHGITVDDADRDLIPGPTLTVALLDDLARRESMPALVGGLVSWNAELCSGLQKAMAEYEASGQLQVLEHALDRTYFEQHLEPLREDPDPNAAMVLQVLQMELDRINLRMILTMRGPGGETPDVIPGGLINKSKLQRMVEAPSPDEAMEHLEGTPYGELLEGVYEFAQGRRFSHLERLFEKALILQIRKYARIHSLSIAVFLEYTWLKYNEMMNLRLLARGEARYVPRGRIREEMIYV